MVEPAGVISKEYEGKFRAITIPFRSIIKPRCEGVVMIAIRLLSEAVEYLVCLTT